MVLVPKPFSSTPKEELIISKSHSGFSTLEMLIAMTILIMVISAVILVSFGSQSLLIDSQTNAEALNITQKRLEEQQALARKDFKLVNSTPQIQLDPTGYCREGFIREKDNFGNYDIYCYRVDVKLWKDSVTQITDFFTKEVMATVYWKAEHNRELQVKLPVLSH